MDYAIEFNNQGVWCLENNNHEDAMNLFQGAIQSIQFVCSNKTASSNHQSNNAQQQQGIVEIQKAHMILQEYRRQEQEEQEQERRRRYKNFRDVVDGTATTTMNNKNKKSTRRRPSMNNNTTTTNFVTSIEDNHLSFMYRKPIELPSLVSMDLELNDSSDVVKIISAIVLYNTALIHHLSTSEISLSIQKAMTLYKMVYGLFSELNCNFAAPDDDDDGYGGIDETRELSCRLVMAVLNNMAHICYEHMCDYNQTEFYLQQLSNFIISIKNIVRHGIVSSIFMTEREWFFLNSRTFSIVQLVGAPTA